MTLPVDRDSNNLILWGALASLYGKEDGGADTAVWLVGGRSDVEQSRSNLAHQTIATLRQVGVLDDTVMT